MAFPGRCFVKLPLWFSVDLLARGTKMVPTAVNRATKVGNAGGCECHAGCGSAGVDAGGAASVWCKALRSDGAYLSSERVLGVAQAASMPFVASEDSIAEIRHR